MQSFFVCSGVSDLMDAITSALPARTDGGTANRLGAFDNVKGNVQMGSIKDQAQRSGVRAGTDLPDWSLCRMRLTARGRF
jgi:hypothetical protein